MRSQPVPVVEPTSSVMNDVGLSVNATAARRLVGPASGVLTTIDNRVSAATGSRVWYSRTVLVALNEPVSSSELPPSYASEKSMLGVSFAPDDCTIQR